MKTSGYKTRYSINYTRYGLLFSLFLLSYTLIAQESSIFTKKKKSFFTNWSEPKKASVMSAVLPGLGQLYNKKYWKIPVIYGLGGLLTYNVIQQNKNYVYYKSELINVINGGTNAEGYSAQQLTLLKNQSKKWRDLSIAGVVAVYVLNILDANVDAHLKHFDVSDNLTFVVFPSYYWINDKPIGIIDCSISIRF
ncbi:MAG: hypothetical protein KatS3mg027_0180 [Bacteroidia bacterium]|nr:MAG: hypothetical protein KatS3mg027_0180 [Bacteroidia bacterium]